MSAYIRGQMFRPIGVGERPQDDEQSDDSGDEGGHLNKRLQTETVDDEQDLEEEELDDEEEYDEDAEDEEEEEDLLEEDLPYDGQTDAPSDVGQRLTVWSSEDQGGEDDEEYDSITAATESTLRPMKDKDNDRPRLVDFRPKVTVVALADDEDYDLEDDVLPVRQHIQTRASTAPAKLEPPRSPKPEVAPSLSPRPSKAIKEAKLGSPKSIFRPEIKLPELPPSWSEFKFSRQEMSPTKPEVKFSRPLEMATPKPETSPIKPTVASFKPDVVSTKPEVKLSRQEIMSSRPLGSSFARPAVVAPPPVKLPQPPLPPPPPPPPVPEESPDVVNQSSDQSDTYASFLTLPMELTRDALCSAREVWSEVRQLACGGEGQEVGSWRPNHHFQSACFHYASLLMATYVYLFAGAFLFKLLEGFFEVRTKCDVQRHRHDLIEDLWNRSAFLDYDDWRRAARDHLRQFEATVHSAHQQGVTGYSGTQTWSLDGSLVYAATILTTIGYGHIVPSTTAGRVATILYAVVGIPLLLMVLADFGKLLTRGIKCLHSFVVRFYHTGSCRKLRRTRPVKAVTKFMFTKSPDGGAAAKEGEMSEEWTGEDGGAIYDGEEAAAEEENPEYPVIDDEFDLPAWITILLLVAYILTGACMFIQWEKHWSYFEAVYFVFISMSTIGFGDFVPEHPIFMMGTFVYLLFGLALTSMCINVIQESLTKSFRQASIKLSARMGLELAEAPPPSAPEIAPVHYPAKRKEQ